MNQILKSGVFLSFLLFMPVLSGVASAWDNTSNGNLYSFGGRTTCRITNPLSSKAITVERVTFDASCEDQSDHYSIRSDRLVGILLFGFESQEIPGPACLAGGTVYAGQCKFYYSTLSQ